MKTTNEEKADALKQLRKLVRPGSTVYCVLRSVSSSGMSRCIDFFTIRKGEHAFLSGYIGRALGYSRPPKGDGLRVQGCGMDMGFHVVYEVGRTLWPKGFKLAKGQRGRNGDKSGFDNDGGYALRHRWL